VSSDPESHGIRREVGPLRAGIEGNEEGNEAVETQEGQDEALRELLNATRSIAVVGIKSGESDDAFRVPHYLQSNGYRIIPVNPRYAGKKVLGETCYASLKDIPDKVDLVDVFRRSEDVMPIAEDAIAISNDSIYGLAASIWTADVNKAHRFARDIEAGVVWINCFDHGDMTSIWGGYKQSGFGRDKCLESLLYHTQTKSVWLHIGDE